MIDREVYQDINQSIPAGINCSCDVTNELTIRSAIKRTPADSHIISQDTPVNYNPVSMLGLLAIQ